MGLNNIIQKKFKDSFETKCYRLIIDAYHTSISENEIKLSWDENDISSELQSHMESHPLRSEWEIFTVVEFHIPTSINKVKGFAAKYPRIDFKMSVFHSKKQYDYFLEAKNLEEGSSSLKRRYINTGINSFTSKKYTNGSLIGYLLEGDISKTVDGINSLLKKDGKVSEYMVAISNPFHTDYYESVHMSIGTLKHLIFDFTTMAN